MATEYKAGLRIVGTNSNRTTDFPIAGWSSIADLPETRGIHFMAGGNKNSAIQTQGSKDGSNRYKNTTYTWNGSAWSTGNNNSVFEIFISLKYSFSASICESILIPKAIVFFGIFSVLLVREINVILFISLSLSRLSKKIGPITIFIPSFSNSLADSYVSSAVPLLSFG